jgi:class 3 adenylate cyclase/Tfp pilus assembly protein PilF
MGLFLFVNTSAQKYTSSIDSLEQSYQQKKYTNKKEELDLLLDLSREHNDPQKIIMYSDKIIEWTNIHDSVKIVGYLQKGSAYRLKGDYSKALSAFFVASRIADKINDEIKLAMTNVAIGDAYSEIGDHEKSIDYYEKSIIKFREKVPKSILLATALTNAGDEYFNEGNYDKAMSYFFESSSICKMLDDKTCSAYNLGNIGMVYAKQNKPKLAEENINEAIQILENNKDYYAISFYLIYISDLYLESGDITLARQYAERSLELAQKYSLKNEISEAYHQLSEIFENAKEPDKALETYKKFIQYRDSVNGIENMREMGDIRTEYEVSKKQIEIDLAKQKNKNERIIMYSFLGGLILVSSLAFGLFRRNRYIQKTKKLLDIQKEKADELLMNILPEDTAKELKENGKVIAKKYQSVTVLFTDFKGFTKIAENLPPEKLVEAVDMYYTEFDRIIRKYNLEKIKTIGDSYMCAGGLPVYNNTHPMDTAYAALEILEYVEKLKQVHSVGDVRFDVRIGVHTGPVVAGIVGKNKFSYDIWGDTVNIASRMESSSQAGKINVSDTTYQLIKDKFEFEKRGELPVKNSGKIGMYYLYRKKS